MKLLYCAVSLCACICACGVADWSFFATNNINEPLAMPHTIVPPAFTINELIRAASHKHQLKPALVKGIIAAESGFSAKAVSSKGAIGLMQLMPATARDLGADPTVPEQNVEAGTRYLSWLLHRYANKRDQLRRTIAAYNAGPGNVERYHGIPPYRETRKYVAVVLRYMKKYQNEGMAD
jgi:soluble lytic murein transglycosylase-like protein